MSDTTHIKFESPAETLVDSFASTPANYSLFPDSMDMSSHSYDDDSMFGDGSVTGTPAPEKKPVKKRKSWGQQLPEPKTNLPPRKRAKTEDEKEQRRVERVLRNRRAAQSSRERKRQEVEALENEKKAIEQRNQDLEQRLAEMAAQNALLQQQIQQITGGNMRVFQGSSVASSPAAERVRTPAPVTFSQDLFGSRETEHRVSVSSQSIPDSRTVNPASLSPEIRPVAESTNASSSDMTQHPAAMLCDLQCQSEEQRPWNTASTTMISHLLAITLLINMTSTTISTLLSPLNQIVSCLKTGSSLPSTPSIPNLIIWLVTTTTSLRSSTSTISSTKTTSSGPRFSLRIRLLRRLLACSPNLARPLMDATMVALRSASEQQLFHSRISGNEGHCQGENRSPSVESLMTLLWAIRVISKEERSQQDIPKLDVAMEIRQVCEELDGMFRRGEGLRRDTHSLSYDMTDTGMTGKSQKSLGGGRTAYP